MKKSMRILFLTSAHNNLSQRLWIKLGELGHKFRVCVAATGEAMIAAVSRETPDLIVAPMLKIAIPEEVWSRHRCLIDNNCSGLGVKDKERAMKAVMGAEGKRLTYRHLVKPHTLKQRTRALLHWHKKSRRKE